MTPIDDLIVETLSRRTVLKMAGQDLWNAVRRQLPWWRRLLFSRPVFYGRMARLESLGKVRGHWQDWQIGDVVGQRRVYWISGGGTPA